MKKDTIQYSGYDNFKCITDKCKHTCCAGWKIDIDNETYKRYESSIYFKKDIKSKFVKDEKNKFSMKMNKDKKCSFLQDDKLCEIHANLGEELLCNTCRLYPRGVNLVGDRIERFLYSSCPAMIELFLLSDKKLTFEMTKGAYNEDEVSNVISFESDMEKIVFTAIRGFTIEVIQSNFIDMEKKFILMGLAYSNFDEFIKTKDYDAVLNAIDIYSEMIEDSNIIPRTEYVAMYDEIKKIVLSEIANFNLSEKLRNLIPSLESVLENEISREESKFREKYLFYIKNNSTYIENYLVNAVYSTGMPVLDGDIMDNYILLVIKYIVFKTYITAVSEEEIHRDNFIDIVALSSRTFDHNKKAVDMLVEELKTLANISEDSIALLVNLVR